MDGAPVESTPDGDAPQAAQRRRAIIAVAATTALVAALIVGIALATSGSGIDDAQPERTTAPRSTTTSAKVTTTKVTTTKATTRSTTTSTATSVPVSTTTKVATSADDVGSGSGSNTDGTEPPAVAPTVAGNQVSRVATALDGVSSIDVYQSAAGERLVLPGSDGALSIANPSEDGVPAVFLIKSTSNAGSPSEAWLEVALPVRPNGSTGWIKASSVSVSEHRYRIVVELGAHRLTLFNDGQVAESFPIGVGTGDTPTPGGEFYIKELLQPPDPNGSYGTYAYGLSGYSDVLQSFNGGSGVVGIHGTNDDSTIGRDVSHGCIRLHNSDIEKLVGILPLGVPVEIRA